MDLLLLRSPFRTVKETAIMILTVQATSSAFNAMHLTRVQFLVAMGL